MFFKVCHTKRSRNAKILIESLLLPFDFARDDICRIYEQSAGFYNKFEANSARADRSPFSRFICA